MIPLPNYGGRLTVLEVDLIRRRIEEIDSMDIFEEAPEFVELQYYIKALERSHKLSRIEESNLRLIT